MVKTNLLRKILNQFLKVMLGLIVILIIIYAIISIIEPKKVINTFKYQQFVIQTNSMVPVINVGDIVVVKEINFDDLKPNDIITFYADINSDGKKEVVTHYFDSIETLNGEEIFRTRRANTTTLDTWRVNKNDILGEYVFKIPKVGKVVMFLKEPIGLVVLFVDVTIIYLLIKLTKKENKKNI